MDLFNSRYTIPANVLIKSGETISFTAYYGESKVAAYNKTRELENAMLNHEPVSLNSGDIKFTLLVSDVDMDHLDIVNMSGAKQTIYHVEVEGKVLELNI